MYIQRQLVHGWRVCEKGAKIIWNFIQHKKFGFRKRSGNVRECWADEERVLWGGGVESPNPIREWHGLQLTAAKRVADPCRSKIQHDSKAPLPSLNITYVMHQGDLKMISNAHSINDDAEIPVFFFLCFFNFLRVFYLYNEVMCHSHSFMDVALIKRVQVIVTIKRGPARIYRTMPSFIRFFI